MSALVTNNKLRVISNYLRLLTTFLSGFIVVRLLAEIGASTLNIYLIVISGTGFAFFMKIVMQESIVPLLGLSFEGRENRNFEQTYWISFLFAGVASLFAVAIFGGLWLLRHHFDAGQLSVQTLGIALATGALRTIVSTLVTPPLHAVLITGRIVAYNVVLAGERLADVAAVGIVFWVLGGTQETQMANGFFLISAALYILVQIIGAAYAMRLDKRFGIHPMPVETSELHWARDVFGWNIAIVIAFLLYLRFSTLMVNVTFGEGATLVLGLVFLLIGYQRQISIGLVIGLDAMVARIFGSATNHADKKQAMTSMILQSTYVQSIFSFGSITLLWVLVDQIFHYWLGDSLKDSGWNVEAATSLFRIMSFGVLARSLSENWMKILNGRGLVGAYAPWLLIGGLIYSALLLFWINTGEHIETILRYLAISFSGLYVINHLLIIPWLLNKDNNSTLFSLAAVALIPGGILSLLMLGSAGMFHPDASILRLGLWLTVCAVISLLFLWPRMMGFFLRRLTIPKKEAK